MIISLTAYSGIALLLLRILVGIIFVSSGYKHVSNPTERAEGLGMNKTVVLILGIIQMLAATALILGLYVQVAAGLLAGVMLGAMHKKIFVWNTGFYADTGYGWHYDALLFAANAVFFTIGGGALTLL